MAISTRNMIVCSKGLKEYGVSACQKQSSEIAGLGLGPGA